MPRAWSTLKESLHLKWLNQLDSKSKGPWEFYKDGQLPSIHQPLMVNYLPFIKYHSICNYTGHKLHRSSFNHYINNYSDRSALKKKEIHLVPNCSITLSTRKPNYGRYSDKRRTKLHIRSGRLTVLLNGFCSSKTM